MDRLVLAATQHVSVTAKETSKDQVAIVVMISILDYLPANLVCAIQKGLSVSTAMLMGNVLVKVFILVISAINVQVDITRTILGDV